MATLKTLILAFFITIAAIAGFGYVTYLAHQLAERVTTAEGVLFVLGSAVTLCTILVFFSLRS